MGTCYSGHILQGANDWVNREGGGVLMKHLDELGAPQLGFEVEDTPLGRRQL